MLEVGKFKHGSVKKTKGQRKKHVTQMSEWELQRLCRRVKRIKHFKPSYHLKEKVAKQEVSYSYKMIADVIKNIHTSHIVEYNLTNIHGTLESRVLLRSNKWYPVNITGKGEIKCNLCFVVSLDRGKLITAYWNAIGDNHASINLNRYDATLTIKG